MFLWPHAPGEKTLFGAFAAKVAATAHRWRVALTVRRWLADTSFFLCLFSLLQMQ